MHELYLALSKSKLLSDVSIESLVKVWNKSKRLDTKEILLHRMNLESNLYFIVTGCVRLFVIDNNEEEINIGFGHDNTIITSFQSFIQEKPSLLSIEAIMETELLSISKTELTHLIKQNKEIAQWYQSMLETALSGHIQRQIELLTLSPQEKYEVFIKRSGHLINKIPLKQIASYLMMTPETLSRVRAKIS
jgi:CRP/FNR family transcriptional regulator, anaerobic regulatory protein